MDQIKRTPATPLPRNLAVCWTEKAAHLESSDGERLATTYDSLRGNQLEAVAHAANAYPKLVEALREYIKADRMRDFERGQREPAFQHRRPSDAAVVLLRSLGEDA